MWILILIAIVVIAAIIGFLRDGDDGAKVGAAVGGVIVLKLLFYGLIIAFGIAIFRFLF